MIALGIRANSDQQQTGYDELNHHFLRGQAGGDGRPSAEMKLSGVAVTDNDECLKPVEFINICSHKVKVKSSTKTHTAVSIPESLGKDFL